MAGAVGCFLPGLHDCNLHTTEALVLSVNRPEPLLLLLPPLLPAWAGGLPLGQQHHRPACGAGGAAGGGVRARQPGPGQLRNLLICFPSQANWMHLYLLSCPRPTADFMRAACRPSSSFCVGIVSCYPSFSLWYFSLTLSVASGAAGYSVGCLQRRRFLLGQPGLFAGARIVYTEKGIGRPGAPPLQQNAGHLLSACKLENSCCT